MNESICNTPIYHLWERIKSRCYNKNNNHYHCYGGRGIKMYEEWINSSRSFYDWFKNEFGINEIPKGLSLDRINNDGNYEPGNLRIVNQEVQGNNRRTNKIFEYDGKTLTISQWAKQLNIPRKTLERRFQRRFDRNWTIEDCLSMPLDLSKSNKKGK